MSRFVYVTACWLVALNCVEKTVGEQSQVILAADLIWLWWIPAALWFVGGFAGFSRRVFEE